MFAAQDALVNAYLDQTKNSTDSDVKSDRAKINDYQQKIKAARQALMTAEDNYATAFVNKEEYISSLSLTKAVNSTLNWSAYQKIVDEALKDINAQLNGASSDQFDKLTQQQAYLQRLLEVTTDRYNQAERTLAEENAKSKENADELTALITTETNAKKALDNAKEALASLQSKLDQTLSDLDDKVTLNVTTQKSAVNDAEGKVTAAQADYDGHPMYSKQAMWGFAEETYEDNLRNAAIDEQNYQDALEFLSFLDQPSIDLQKNKDELKKLQDQLATDTAARDQLQKDVTADTAAKQQAVKDAQATLDEAQAKLNELKGDQATKDAAVATAEAKANATAQAVKDAEATLAAAQKEQAALDQKVNDLTNADEKLAQAKKDLAAAQTLVTHDEEDLALAKKELAAAQAELAAAKDRLAAAEAALAAAQAKLQVAKDKLAALQAIENVDHGTTSNEGTGTTGQTGSEGTGAGFQGQDKQDQGKDSQGQETGDTNTNPTAQVKAADLAAKAPAKQNQAATLPQTGDNARGAWLLSAMGMLVTAGMAALGLRKRY